MIKLNFRKRLTGQGEGRLFFWLIFRGTYKLMLFIEISEIVDAERLLLAFHFKSDD